MASSEAELAGVIGHEIGHVTARHAAERMYAMEKAQDPLRQQFKQKPAGLAMGLRRRPVFDPAVNHQEDDCDNNRGDKARPFACLIPANGLPYDTSQERAGDADQDGHDQAHVFLARMDQLGNEANDKTQHDRPDDAHVLTSPNLDVE